MEERSRSDTPTSSRTIRTTWSVWHLGYAATSWPRGTVGHTRLIQVCQYANAATNTQLHLQAKQTPTKLMVFYMYNGLLQAGRLVLLQAGAVNSDQLTPHTHTHTHTIHMTRPSRSLIKYSTHSVYVLQVNGDVVMVFIVRS